MYDHKPLALCSPAMYTGKCFHVRQCYLNMHALRACQPDLLYTHSEQVSIHSCTLATYMHLGRIHLMPAPCCYSGMQRMQPGHSPPLPPPLGRSSWLGQSCTRTPALGAPAAGRRPLRQTIDNSCNVPYCFPWQRQPLQSLAAVTEQSRNANAQFGLFAACKPLQAPLAVARRSWQSVSETEAWRTSSL